MLGRLPGRLTSLNSKLDYASKTWQAMKTFGYPSIQTALNGNKIHSLTNILTLEYGLHLCFAKLDLWLEPTV